MAEQSKQPRQQLRYKRYRVRPRPVRMAIYAVLALVATFGGVLLGGMLKKSEKAQIAVTGPAQPGGESDQSASPPGEDGARAFRPPQKGSDWVKQGSKEGGSGASRTIHIGEEKSGRSIYEEPLPDDVNADPAVIRPLDGPVGIRTIVVTPLGGRSRIVEVMPPGQGPSTEFSSPTAPAAPEPKPAAPQVAPEPVPAVKAPEVAALPSQPIEAAPPAAVAPPPSAPLELVVPAPAEGEAVQAWQKFAVAAVPPDGRPAIAVVIDDMGLDRARSARIVALPGPLTVSYLTYAEHLPEQTRAARAAGHELMVHVPMEPSGQNVDPGPNVLMTGMPEQEIRAILDWGLDRFDGFVGLNNHMGSRFTQDLDGMRVVMDEVRKRGLLFLDSRTAAHTMGAKAAHEIGVPVVERNVFLDNDDDATAVAKRLAELERIATKNGVAVAIGHPRDGTIEALGKWLATLEARGFVLVPLSAVITRAAMAEGTG